jgi:hypothetical protein
VDVVSPRQVRALALDERRQLELAECPHVAAIGLRLGRF